MSKFTLWTIELVFDKGTDDVHIIQSRSIVISILKAKCTLGTGKETNNLVKRTGQPTKQTGF